MKLIKNINDSLKPKDPVVEAMKSLVNDTTLDDEQIESLADYMHEMIRDREQRGGTMQVADAAFMALEDVAGFEVAPKKEVQKTVERMITAYKMKFD